MSGIRLSIAISFAALLIVAPALSHAQFVLSDERSGMTCAYYQASARLAWLREGGDWQDVDGVSHGDRPFARQIIARTREPQLIEWNITELARAWERGAAPAGGIYLRQLADDAASSVKFHSREYESPADRPRLVIDWSDGGRSELQPSADATMTCTSHSGKGTSSSMEVGNRRSAILVFPFESRSGRSVRNAQLVLVSDRQYRSASDIGVFRLFAPFARSLDKKKGIAAAYRLDVGIESHPAVVFATGFESSRWLDEWSSISESSVANRVSRDASNKLEPLSGNALKVTVESGKKTGLNLLYRFREKKGAEPDEMYFRYYLRFGNDWNPRVGGKLPGFAGTYGKAGWGGRKPDGTDGWSARGRYVTPIADDGDAYPIGSYVYHAALSTKYGDGWGWNLGPTGVLEKNRWYSVEQHVMLNDPGASNGVLRAWVDGVLVFERRDIRFRETHNLGIETLWMNVYHGGTSSAPSDLSLYIDNVVVATEYIGPAAGVEAGR